MASARIGFVWLIVFALTTPIAVVLSTHLARKSFEKVQLRTQTIMVKGYAEKPIESDRAVWSATIVQRNPKLAEGYAKLEADRAALLTFLSAHGFGQPELSPVGVEVIFKKNEKGTATNEIEYYVVSQTTTVGGADVRQIAKAAHDASDLIKDGIELTSNPPQFIYTKLNELKLTMLGEASDNARQRAQQLVEHGGAHLGPMRSASQGVFQITPAFSTEVSGSGENDTGSIDKVIKAVVNQEYAIE